MLKGISNLISPRMLMVLSEMGHGDRIVLADGNFPAESVGRNSLVIRADGHGIPQLLEAILPLFPLDTAVASPVNVMAVSPGDNVEPHIWEEYQRIIRENDPRAADAIGQIERFAFYEQARSAYAIIATGESALYGNIMLQKGVIT